MRALFSHTIAFTRPAGGEAWFVGLPHVVAAASTWPVFGGAACVAGVLMTSLVSFVLFLPLTALALNDGRPLTPDDTAPVLTPNAKRGLFILWTATAWAAAALARS